MYNKARFQATAPSAERPMMKVLLVDNYDSFTFNLLQLIEEAGCECEVRSNDRLTGGVAERFDKILISPGPGIPSEAGALCKLLRTLAGRKSILGICLGHQAIAEVYGAKLQLLSTPSHGLRKRIRITDPASPLFAGLPSEIEVGLYHSWTVSAEDLPACLSVTARSDDGTIMALSHREFDLQGIQFHPESVMTPYGRQIVENWLAERPIVTS